MFLILRWKDSVHTQIIAERVLPRTYQNVSNRNTLLARQYPFEVLCLFGYPVFELTFGHLFL